MSIRARPISRKELRDNPPIYLLELDIAGRTYRLARRTTTIDDDAGDPHLYRGDLVSVDHIAEIGLLTASPPRRTVSAQLLMPSNMATLASRGYQIQGSEGRLYLWVKGRTWENRLLLLRGKLTNVEFRGAGESSTITIDDIPASGGVLIPPATAVIDSTTWPNADDVAVGNVYPMAFGRPGVFTDTDGTEVTPAGSPAYLTDTAGTETVPYGLLISDREVVAGTVTINDLTTPTSYTSRAVTIGSDGRGRTVSLVELTSSQAGSPGFGLEFSTTWAADGGIQSDQVGSSDIRGMGDLLAWMLRRSGRLIDWGSVSGLVPELNQYSAGAFTNQRIDPFEWITDNLLPLLPMWIGGGPNGIRFGIWNPPTGNRTAQFRFREGQHGSLASDPRTEGDIVNDITIDAGYGFAQNVHRRRRTLTPSFDVAEESVPTWYAGLSQARNGVVSDNIKSEAFGDPGTGALMLLKMARLKSIPYRVHEYRASPEWLAITEGAEGTLTHASIGLTDAPCILQAKRYGSASAMLRFIVQDDPALRLS